MIADVYALKKKLDNLQFDEFDEIHGRPVFFLPDEVVLLLKLILEYLNSFDRTSSS